MGDESYRDELPTLPGDLPAARSWRVPPSPFPMWIFDESTGAILAANEAAQEEYGYSLAELLKRNVRDICVPRDPLRAPPSDDDVAALDRCETRLQRRKDGTTFLADLDMVETGEVGQAAKMVVVDVLPRKLQQLAATPTERDE